jgi:hypothetical protein
MSSRNRNNLEPKHRSRSHGTIEVKQRNIDVDRVLIIVNLGLSTINQIQGTHAVRHLNARKDCITFRLSNNRHGVHDKRNVRHKENRQKHYNKPCLAPNHKGRPSNIGDCANAECAYRPFHNKTRVSTNIKNFGLLYKQVSTSRTFQNPKITQKRTLIASFFKACLFIVALNP